MEVTDELIDKLARLNCLQFDLHERAQLKEDLSRMIGFVDQLADVDVEAVEPLQHMTSGANQLRTDISATVFSRELALKNAPLADGTFFKVPKVIQK